MNTTKRFALSVAAIAALCITWGVFREPRTLEAPSSSTGQAISKAFENQKSGVQVTGEGVVTKILQDDRDGSRHQRFIVRLASGQTLLVAHNIDIAPRVESLKPGDEVDFCGVYEWNAQGGTVHWTHHDPSGQHQAGWLKHEGQTFQ